MNKYLSLQLLKRYLLASGLMVATGILLSIASLQSAYSLVGRCQLGSVSCTGPTWQASGLNIGGGLVVVGLVLVIIIGIAVLAKGR